MGKTIGEWIGGVVFDAAKAALDKLEAFGRTKTPTQQKDDLEVWNHVHVPLHTAPNPCAVCGKPRARDVEHCPGPMKPWVAPDAVTRRCFHRGVGLLGCAICDPQLNGGVRYG